MSIEIGDIVEFVDEDPEFDDLFGMVGSVWFVLPPTDQDPDPLIQVDYHGSYGVHRPDQLEKLL